MQSDGGTEKKTIYAFRCQLAIDHSYRYCMLCKNRRPHICVHTGTSTEFKSGIFMKLKQKRKVEWKRKTNSITFAAWPLSDLAEFLNFLTNESMANEKNGRHGARTNSHTHMLNE